MITTTKDTKSTKGSDYATLSAPLPNIAHGRIPGDLAQFLMNFNGTTD
ncbi:MAG: hypothetical protein ABGX16_08150 [Pirellulales bacterium]